MIKGHKISVIVPSFNQGQFIEETLLSIINQTYKNFEIIVIDGGSTDNTVEILRKYQSYFSYWVTEKDSGQSEAINKGLAKASGEIITWLNSDDYYEPNTLEIVNSEFSKNPRTDIVHGKAILFGDTFPARTIGLKHDLPLYEYLAFMRFPQPSSFFSAAVFKQLGSVNNDLHYVMDFDLVVRAILSGFRVKRIDAVLAHYRLHKTSKSNDQLAFSKGWSDVVYALFLSLPGGEIYASKMLELKLVQASTSLGYQSAINITSDQLEKIFLLHLQNCYHTLYSGLYKTECLKISEFLKEGYPEFYLENDFSKYDLRLKLIPKFIFKLFRSER